MRRAVREGLFRFLDSSAEGEEEVRLRDAWSLDDQDRVRAAGPLHTSPDGSYYIGVLFTSTTVKILPPAAAWK